MTADTLTAAVLRKPPSMRRLIVAATIGNVFEWFDFVVYGFFALTLAEVFFPAGNPTVSLLITFGAFGLAYFVRPLGAIVVGSYTDRAGRKAGLLLSILLMMIGTSLMGLALTAVWTHDQLVRWGWRIPYIFGMLVGPAGLYIRAKMVETPEFLEAEKPETMPISDLLRR